jgi:hypothetical protein
MASSDGRKIPYSAASIGATAKRDPGPRIGQKRVDEQDADPQARPELGDLHHAPAVEGIGQGASDEGHDHQRDELRQAQKADRERRVGQLVGLVRQRNVRDHRAEERGGLPHEEKPEVPVAAERTDVDGRGSSQSPQATGFLDTRHRRDRAQALGFVQRVERGLAVDPRRL